MYLDIRLTRTHRDRRHYHDLVRSGSKLQWPSSIAEAQGFLWEEGLQDNKNNTLRQSTDVPYTRNGAYKPGMDAILTTVAHPRAIVFDAGGPGSERKIAEWPHQKLSSVRRRQSLRVPS